MERPRLLLADDHVIVADGLRSLLREEFDLVGSVADGLSLVHAAERLRADVIVSDLAMPGLDGFGVLRQLAPLNLPSRVIVLTMHADVHLATEAFRLGAWGYVLKNSAGDELVTAIREVLEGRAYLTPLVSREDLALFDGSVVSRGVRPTIRQRQVLRLIAEGKRMKEIAAILHLSPRTVESHKYEMMESLGLRSTAELILYALRNPDLGA